jgi:ATP-dependent DNA helicase
MRQTVMARPGARPVQAKKGASKGKTKPKTGRPRKAKPRELVSEDGKARRMRGRPRKSVVILESDEEEMQVDEPEVDAGSDDYTANFPVVLTTYEMVIKDRTHLAHYEWGYIVVDEGHRLKNLDCKLMKEIKKYSSAGRMILTGTPLHVRLIIPVHFWRSNVPHRII